MRETKILLSKHHLWLIYLCLTETGLQARYWKFQLLKGDHATWSLSISNMGSDYPNSVHGGSNLELLESFFTGVFSYGFLQQPRESGTQTPLLPFYR